MRCTFDKRKALIYSQTTFKQLTHYSKIIVGWTSLQWVAVVKARPHHYHRWVYRRVLPACDAARSPAAATYISTTHTHPFNGPLSGTTRVSQYQKGKTNLDFTGARDSGWQWHQLSHMQVCTSLQIDNHASTPPLKFFLQAGCPSCCPTNSVKALKEQPTPVPPQQ